MGVAAAMLSVRRALWDATFLVSLALLSGWRAAPRSAESAVMPLDVSPDGRTIVFARQGDLYTLPIDGGRAHRITSGPAIDSDPSWSPDGKRIAFSSNRGEWENVWTIEPSTGRLAAVTTDTLPRHVVTTAWSPDGSELVISFGESAPGFEIVPLAGDARQRYRTEPSGRVGTRGVTGAIFSRDARSLLFQSGGPSAGDTQLYRYDRFLRQQRAITSEPRSAMRPVLSHNGRRLAFATRGDSGTIILKIRDIDNGTEQAIRAAAASDANYAANGIAVPGYAFMPNGTALVMSGGGKFWRVDIANGARREIHFEATLNE